MFNKPHENMLLKIYYFKLIHRYFAKSLHTPHLLCTLVSIRYDCCLYVGAAVAADFLQVQLQVGSTIFCLFINFLLRRKKINA